ncbi:glycosyl transferase [Novosphingobium indicum]|uniref:Glycosyl transferase n=1 Tax=Novosphingobium indicum TaxID=462949 RepID=A0ABQ2K273_9SPHN|nr:glycosyl transferase [Novosphingobium indicum]
MIGTFPPRKCGIATFTSDLDKQLTHHHPSIEIDVYPLVTGEDRSDNPRAIESTEREAFISAARAINESGVEAVWLQHEYGIFGGPDGDLVCERVDRLAPPLILTCHTVLAEPSPRQQGILRHLVSRASQIMVMSRHSLKLLNDIYGAPEHILTLIEHGASDPPFGRQADAKRALGLSERKVLMTFGLLGPGKGLETAIEALPAIIEKHPDVLYRIVGATHPNLVAHEGEAYRDRLVQLLARLGLEANVEWDNRFLETDELLDQIEACDIYLTPYPGMQQSTSGTLSYAVAMGKAVPYLHARELLADGVGHLVPAGSSAAIAGKVKELLGDPQALLATQRRAYARGRETIWPRFADAAASLVAKAAQTPRAEPGYTAVPSLAGVISMSDATGMMQHSVGIVPDRTHGYCLDDNARALMLMNVAEGMDAAERQRWSMVYASFIQHAWNPDAKAFRNFMRFDRGWCEETGSDDSNGRALWALGHTISHSPDEDIREWALGLYDRTLPYLAALSSPRALAFVMLGAAARLRAQPDHPFSRKILTDGGEVLASLLKRSRRPHWVWFEAMLAYDNPRLPQALAEAGALLERPVWIAEALETLRWIASMQTSTTGHFRPIGSDTFGKEGEALPFDQQPLEAQDGKNLYLLRSDTLDCWDDEGVLLMEPRYPWEFIQIGNCGSPILTDAGWLLFTHGVGAMRKYALGCALLDRGDPSKVLARSVEPVLTAENADRGGYVPNVIYTCGALRVEKRLLIP